MEIGRWSKKPLSFDPLGYGLSFTSRLTKAPHAEIFVGDRNLIALRKMTGFGNEPQASVASNVSIAEAQFWPGYMSIPGMHRGFTVTADGREARIWTPRFGLTLRSRSICPQYGSATWRIAPETRSRYRVTAGNGSDIVRKTGRNVVIEETLPADELCLPVLVHVTDLVETSSLLSRVMRSL